MKLHKTVLASFLVLSTQHALAATFKTEKWQTKNGVPVVFYQAMEVPMLDISMAFAAGSAYDGKKHGLSALTTQLINQGNAGQDATAVAEALANTGAQFNAETSREMLALNLRTLTDAKAMEKATTTFAQIINHPDVPEDAFMREQKQQLMAIEQVQESPEEVAALSFFKTLYQDHPYAHPVTGSKTTVAALKRHDVLEFYHRYFIANNAVLVMVGAIDSHQAHQLAERLTHELPKGTPAAQIGKAAPLGSAAHVNIPFPSSQTVVRLGQLGIDYQDPNYFPLMVGNYILGGGSLVSRLSVEVREKRGLTYGVSSQFAPMPGDGPFIISLSTRNKEADNALNITKKTLHHFMEQGPDAKELMSAKHYMTGSFPLSLSSNRAIANLLLRMAFYHLPDDYLETYRARVNAVTGKEITEAFKKQINPEKLLLVTVGQS